MLSRELQERWQAHQRLADEERAQRIREEAREGFSTLGVWDSLSSIDLRSPKAA